ncbi:peptidase S41-like protein [Flavobacterium endophyticum]|uniref:Peptidase S41-like protein n=2 Tax=Flavobacterium endophyticum TaxID=1540163 RepID=A0A495M6T7_9FLAO|nr:peptidase S41-like protein [Flavobacterium endophyticum]
MKRFRLLVLPLFMLCSIHFGHAQKKSNKGVTRHQIVSLVDSLKKSLNSYYIFPDKALLISNHLSSQLAKGVYKNNTDPAKLASQFENDIRSIHYDSHLHISFEPGMLAPNKMSPEERTKAMEEFLATERDNNFNLQKVEVLPGNIGYFLFNGFTGSVDEAKPILNAALTFLSGTKTLIIDLRYNGGGNTANRLESYFFKERTHLYDNVNTFEKNTISVFSDPSATNGLTLLMPVYILTSKNTFSAAEAFSASMQSLKRAVIVGENTGGGSHMTGTFDLGGGFIARIPFARPISTAAFKDWEGTGVTPDIPVEASKALEKAQEVIYQDLLSQAKSEKDKMKIQWAMNMLIAEQNPPNLSAASYNKYVGTYVGGLKFYIENDQFVCENSGRGGSNVFKLIPIFDDTYVLDENVQIQFVKDEKNIYSSLKMLWKDGHVTENRKE